MRRIATAKVGTKSRIERIFWVKSPGKKISVILAKISTSHVKRMKYQNSRRVDIPLKSRALLKVAILISINFCMQ
jgi:hypothetical protein